jgi:hypothetical protein
MEKGRKAKSQEKGESVKRRLKVSDFEACFFSVRVFNLFGASPFLSFFFLSFLIHI